MCDSCCACTHLASTQTVTHEYLTQSGKVMRETVRTDGTVTSVLDFIYDESGKPFAMIDQLGASPKTYYYVLNLQGDVVKLIDQDGAEVAAYAYDAWGNILSSSGSMAEKNPLRYRGYYYDSDTSNAVRSTIKEMTRSDIASAIYSTIKDFVLVMIK
mgnify:CR=1 FL=1